MTILIRRGEVFDARRNHFIPGDIFIAQGKISAIGSFPEKPADVVIDAQGAQSMPGFVDAANGADHYLEPFLRSAFAASAEQGITTAIGGHGGVSLAPLLYGDLDLFKAWTSRTAVNVDWQDVASLHRALAKRKLATHFGTFAGYDTIRTDVVKNTALPHAPRERAVMDTLARTAIAQGAFGISTGQSLFASAQAFADFGTFMARLGAGTRWSAEVSETGSMLESLDTILKLAASYKLSVFIQNLSPWQFGHRVYEDAMERIALHEDAGHAYFAVPPEFSRPFSARMLLPEWVRHDPALQEKLGDEWFAGKIKKDMHLPSAENLLFISSGDTESMTLDALAAHYGAHTSADAFFGALRTRGLDASIAVIEADEGLLAAALHHPASYIASHGATYEDSGAFETIPALFSRMASAGVPMTHMISKATAIPAERLGIRDCGTLHEGANADITGVKDGATLFTVVNGQAVVQGGMRTSARPGNSILSYGAKN